MTAILNSCAGPTEERPEVVLYRYKPIVFKRLKKEKVFGKDEINRFQIWKTCRDVFERDKVVNEQWNHPSFEFTDGEPYAID